MGNNDTQDKNNRWLMIIGIILIILLIIGIGLLAFYFIRGTPEVEPTSLPATAAPTNVVATEPAPAETEPPASGDIVFQTYSVDRDRITAGECANISWLVENADLIQLKRDSAVVLDHAPASHTYQACLNDQGIYVYRLEAANASNSNWIELQVIVESDTGASAATQSPVDTGPNATLPPATGTVTTNLFYVEPQRISVGGCATIYWEVLNADQIRLLRDEVVVVPIGQLEDSFTDCHDQAAIYKYRLESENSENYFSILELQLIVDP